MEQIMNYPENKPLLSYTIYVQQDDLIFIKSLHDWFD